MFEIAEHLWYTSAFASRYSVNALVWPEEKASITKYECNPYQHKLNLFSPPIKKLVQKNFSFYKDLSFPHHSERNLGHLPILFSIMRLRDTSLKTGIWHNRIAFAECNIVVTVLRLIVTDILNSLSIKWLHPIYTEHWSNNKTREQQLEIYHSMFRDKRVNHSFHYFL